MSERYTTASTQDGTQTFLFDGANDDETVGTFSRKTHIEDALRVARLLNADEARKGEADGFPP